MLDIAQSVDNKTSIVDIMQTITAIAALIGAVVSIYFQRREMADSARLNAAATLFQYYNAKISSLRESIIRDTGSQSEARLDPLEKRQQRLDELLKKHETVVDDLEKLYINELPKS